MPRLRKSGLFMAWLSMALTVWLGLFYAHSTSVRADSAERRIKMAREVASYGLTDLCLFTEARYTRHPSQADSQTAFQDHPSSLEHFPSGSMIEPPAHLRNREARRAQND